MDNSTSQQAVNRLAKHLKKKLDGAYKMSFSPGGQADVYVTVYYQVPGDAETFNEMHIDLNLATYQEKVRVNVIEMDDIEATLGQFILQPHELEDIGEARQKLWKKVCNCLVKAYQDYDFVF